jgi:hypothetical protein
MPLIVGRRHGAALQLVQQIEPKVLETVSELPDVVDRQKGHEPGPQAIDLHAQEVG